VSRHDDIIMIFVIIDISPLLSVRYQYCRFQHPRIINIAVVVRALPILPFPTPAYNQYCRVLRVLYS
jgi:hypothetical protein